MHSARASKSCARDSLIDVVSAVAEILSVSASKATGSGFD
jgi:hypothetical protein